MTTYAVAPIGSLGVLGMAGDVADVALMPMRDSKSYLVSCPQEDGGMVKSAAAATATDHFCILVRMCIPL